MIVKIQDDNQQDKRIIETSRVEWDYREKDKDDIGWYIILCCHPNLQDYENKDIARVRVYHGDRVFFMNDQGKTIDSKRIVLREERDNTKMPE